MIGWLALGGYLILVGWLLMGVGAITDSHINGKFGSWMFKCGTVSLCVGLVIALIVLGAGIFIYLF